MHTLTAATVLIQTGETMSTAYQLYIHKKLIILKTLSKNKNLIVKIFNNPDYIIAMILAYAEQSAESLSFTLRQNKNFHVKTGKYRRVQDKTKMAVTTPTKNKTCETKSEITGQKDFILFLNPLANFQ